MHHRPKDEMRRMARPTSSQPAPLLFVDRSSIEGRGCFTARPIRKRQWVGELVGERIGRREARRRIAGRRRIRISDVDESTSIDASRGGNATAFINHSCDPNLFERVIRGRMLFFALRDIAPGEELTLNYGESHHNGRKRCRCGAATCRGAI
jgi:uncharacterized protein